MTSVINAERLVSTFTELCAIDAEPTLERRIPGTVYVIQKAANWPPLLFPWSSLPTGQDSGDAILIFQDEWIFVCVSAFDKVPFFDSLEKQSSSSRGGMFMKTAGMVLLLVFAAAAWGLATEQPSLKRGEELFNNTRLGTNGMSCASCHPGGKKLEEAATYKDGELAVIINQCITKPLKGKPLAADSTELKSLVMYLRTFAPATRPKQ